MTKRAKQQALDLKLPIVALEVRSLETGELVHRVALEKGSSDRRVERVLGGLLRNMDTTKYYVLEATK